MRITRPGARRARHLAAAAVAGVTLLVTGCAQAADEPTASAERRAQVAERGASVMPFDLERTTHRFAKQASGGVQTVVADDPGDATQIRLVREHLRREAELFRQGRFDDPARIHGDGMPGLAALRRGAGRVDVAYADTPGGGRITYTTGEAELVAALHDWFDAQVGDHGSHATGG